MRCAAVVTMVLLLLAGGVAQARNIDLVTLPPRAKVQLTIYNSEDLTLVRETRSITFKKGVNRLQFSWANTLIDPTSVYLRPLAREADLEVLDTTFPGDRPQVLIWNVDSKVEAEVPVEVTYFTSGISWAADYVMVTDPAETQARLDGYVTVLNNSGEDYEGAEVRLVVGVINLVEKIAQLAQGQPPGPGPGKPEALKRAIDRAEAKPAVAPAGAEAPAEAAPQIVKEGLSEYFIFTVEATQTIPNGWSQRMVSFKAAAVPFEILYRYRPHQYGPQPARFFLLANDAEHKMGESPLPDGIIRVFRENGKDGLNFFTAQAVKYIPIKEKIELNVGWDKQVVYERVVLDVARQNFIFEDRPNVGPVVVGWDETRKWQEEIRNYRAKPIKMEMRHVLPGDVDFRMEGPRNLYDFQTAEYTMEVASRKPLKWTTEGTFHLGKNQKQQRIQLVGN